jgi:PAS domain S-box-containing protein
MNTLFNVLSLEDSDLDFEIISEQLIKAGYNLNISRAETENEFTSLISNNRYDIILADYNLPSFDAFEALKICNTHCPEVPFICVSGSIGEIMAIELLKMGAVDYVIKDRLERLPFAVKRALEEAEEKKARRLAEEELKKKEINYRTLTENIPDIITRIDKDLRHIYINPAIEKTTGLSQSDYIGKTNEDLGMPHEKVVVWNEHIHRVFETAKQLTFEFDFQTPYGIRYFSSLIVPELDDDGKVSSILTVARDITEHKLAEIALRKSEERLRDIIFTTADWIWEVDVNGRYTYSSQHDVDLFDLAPDEILGKTPFDFMPEDEARKVGVMFQEIMEKKEPIKDLENWNIGKNGERICLLTNGLPIFDTNGLLIGYRGVDKNITERKNAEQELLNAKERAEASDRLKTAFMNNISHEIRTPLNGILGFGQILTDPDFDASAKEEYYRMLNESSDRLLNTITNIMDISLITSGNQKVFRKPIKTNSLISEIIEKFTDVCKRKNIRIFTECTCQEATCENEIYTDGDLLGKIIFQLIDNAVKFTTDGTIEVSCEHKENHFRFLVKDTGIGISKENQSRIFGNFMQEEVENNRRYEGSGIGLSIAKGMVELLGGEIGLESEKGKGTTFYFTLPAINKQ